MDFLKGQAVIFFTVIIFCCALTLSHAEDLSVKSSTTYTLGPGDVIEISVRNHPEFSSTCTVNADGKIQYSFVGDISVTGLTREQLEDKMKKVVAVYVVSPQVNVTIQQYASKVFFVLGAVARPGQYYMHSETISVEDAVIMAGLPVQAAQINKARIIKPGLHGGTFKEVNLYKLFYLGDLKENILLNPGESLVVPAADTESKVFYVLGEVLKPGKYQMSLETITVRDAVIMAGLPSKAAALNKAQIIIPGPNGGTIKEVNLNALLYKGDLKENILLNPGDSLYIPKVADVFPQDNKVNNDFDPLKYTLGADDVVEITVRDRPDFSGTYPVSMEGKIQYKFVGDMDVRGMTKGQLEEKIKKVIAADVVSPEVNVTITEFKSKVFYVLGEVGAPGRYFMRSDNITVSEAVVMAGLPTVDAAMRKTRIITPSINGPITRKVNLYDLLYFGDLKENLLISPGDYLFVPSTILAKVIRIVTPVSTTIGLAVGPAIDAGTAKAVLKPN